MVSAARSLFAHAPQESESQKSKVPCGEGVSAAGFEISFEGLGLSKRFEGDVSFHLPWHESGCMGNLAGIVLCQTGTKIGCAANVALVGVGETAEDVGVVHEELLIGVDVAFIALVLLCCSLALLRQGYGGHHPSLG